MDPIAMSRGPRFDPQEALDRARAAGEALFGPRWVVPMARELGVTRARMRRLAEGREAFNPSLMFLLRHAVQARRRRLEQMEKTL